MGDLWVILMGALDVVAGIMIMVGFNFNVFSVIFGILMLIKGAMSFSFSE